MVMGDVAVFIAIAVVLTLAVLAFVLRPLWRARGSRVALAGLAAGLALAAFAVYRLVGTPMALDPVVREPPRTLEAAIAQLEAQLEREPQSIEGWRLLGRARAAAQEPGRARDAFAEAARLAPDDPDILVEAAEARALASPEHRFDPTGTGMLEHALAVDPRHQRARWFMGIAQRQAGDAAAAARTWEPLLSQVEPATAAPLRQQVDAARADAGLPPLPPAETAPSTASLQVRVALDPALAEQVAGNPDAAVFVFARAAGGPPMPVAAEKRSASELPLVATLDDSDNLMPTRKLSDLQEVEIVARLSRDGTANPDPDDPESTPIRIRLPATAPVEVVIPSR
jgi:cytochrome c-type biogenesis protein CcmH